MPGNTVTAAVVGKNMGHPAVFPIPLAEFFIKLFTKEGDNVLDPFAGSGTTALAALQLDRHATLIDNKPEYVEVAKNRIEKMQIELGFQYKLW